MKDKYIWYIIMGMFPFVIAGGIIFGTMFLESGKLKKAAVRQVEDIGILGDEIAKADIQSLATKEESVKEESVKEEPENEKHAEEESAEEEPSNGEPVKEEPAKGITAKRISSMEISILWDGIYGGGVEFEQYAVMRKGLSDNVVSDIWEEIGVIRTRRNLRKVGCPVHIQDMSTVLQMFFRRRNRYNMSTG